MRKVETKRDPELTKKILLEASEKLFLERGFGRVSLSDIAKESGITKSLIHHYYGSKENLWNQVKQNLFSEYYRQQQREFAHIDDRGDLLENFITLYFDHLKNNPKFVRMVQWIYLENDDQSDRANRELLEAGIMNFQMGIDAGLLRNDAQAFFMQFICIALPQVWFMARDKFILDAGENAPSGDVDALFLDSMKKIIMRGIRR